MDDLDKKIKDSFLHKLLENRHKNDILFVEKYLKDLPDSEVKEATKQFIYHNKMNLVHNYRGNILQSSVEIEHKTELFITLYFCGKNYKKGRELIQGVLVKEKFGFDLKKNVLFMILKANYREYLNQFKYVNKEGANQNRFIENYEKAVTIRNQAAHLKFFPKPQNTIHKDECIYFEDYSTRGNETGKAKRIDLTESRIKENYDTLQYILQRLHEVLILMDATITKEEGGEKTV